MVMACGPSLVAQAGHSKLWGKAGEAWDPRGRLPDYSHAGYRAGDRPLPTVPVKANLRNFGARGDGKTDDTQAFRKAIAATSGGALLIPKGRYLLAGDLHINKSDLVLRGEGDGANETVLYFTKSLEELYGQRPQWSWSGGLVRIAPSLAPKKFAMVTAPCQRGDTTLELSSTAGISAGSLIVLHLDDDAARSLGKHLHNDQADPGNCTWQTVIRHDWPVRVRAVEGRLVKLVQPLRHDVRMSWNPHVRSAPFLSEIGIENLRIEFIKKPTAAHNKEPGYNAIYFERGVVDSWVRDVTIVNADTAINGGTLSKNLEFRDVSTLGRPGHHGIRFEYAADCLVTGFDLQSDWRHALTVNHLVNGCVFSAGSGKYPVEMDHHRDSPFENLFTDIRSATNYNSGGSWCAGPPSGARETFWNLSGSVSVPLFWGHIQTNVIGQVTLWNKQTPDREWFENIVNLQPKDLHLAQLAFRRQAKPGRFSSDPLCGDRASWEERDRARWRVGDDAGDARYHLALSGYASPGGRLGEHAILRDRFFTDGTVTVRARSTEDLSKNSAADLALLIGYTGDRDYCFALFSAKAGDSGLFRVKAGVVKRLAAVATAVISDQRYHKYSFTRTGDSLSMSRNGKRLAIATDTNSPAGGVGIGSRDDGAFFDDLTVDASLSVDRGSLSLATGGRQSFFLDAGSPQKGKLYLLAGSTQGTKPGFRLGSLTLPLNDGPYFRFTVDNPNSFITGSLGRLDAAGRASAVLKLPSGLNPKLAGTVMHHAYVILGTGPFDFTSHAVSLTLER